MPQNIGELRKLIADLPDSMPFEVEIDGLFGSVDEIRVGVENRFGCDIFVCHADITS